MTLRRLTRDRRCRVRRRPSRHSLAAEHTTEKHSPPRPIPVPPQPPGKAYVPAPGHLTGVCPPALRLGSLPTRDACPLSFPYPIIRLHQPPAPYPGAPSQPLAPFSLISGLEKTPPGPPRRRLAAGKQGRWHGAIDEVIPGARGTWGSARTGLTGPWPASIPPVAHPLAEPVINLFSGCLQILVAEVVLPIVSGRARWSLARRLRSDRLSVTGAARAHARRTPLEGLAEGPGKAPGPGREGVAPRFRCHGLIQLNVAAPENDSLI